MGCFYHNYLVITFLWSCTLMVIRSTTFDQCMDYTRKILWNKAIIIGDGIFVQSLAWWRSTKFMVCLGIKDYFIYVCDNISNLLISFDYDDRWMYVGIGMLQLGGTLWIWCFESGCGFEYYSLLMKSWSSLSNFWIFNGCLSSLLIYWGS